MDNNNKKTGSQAQGGKEAASKEGKGSCCNHSHCKCKEKNCDCTCC